VISRRAFLRAGAAAHLRALRFGGQALLTPAAVAARQGQTLYNGITLGNPWPPLRAFADEHPTRAPYLADRPAVVPIDVGRQLFVDDFLIEHTTLGRTFHKATYHAANPVLRPEHEWEVYDDVATRTKTLGNPTAMVYSDGVFFDPADRLFKLWYMGGYGFLTCYATSRDGITWDKPILDVRKGTNVVHTQPRDSSTVWLDLFEKNPAQRFKMSYWQDHAMRLSVSPDGIHWTDLGRTGRAGDRSTFFYNPFRRVWVFGTRADQSATSISGRYRRYWESADFAAARGWSGREPVAWVKADSRDRVHEGLADRPELYNLDCVGYESLMLGLFTIWRGESLSREKINEIELGFSRDGFHWDRPDRSTFLGVSQTPGAWNWANVQSAGGCCLVVGDQLYFYVSGRQGRPGKADPGVCTTGLAVLRRDGFASMDWLPGEGILRGSTGSAGGLLTTRPVRFTGRHLFVNADVQQGELRVEVLDRAGSVIAPFNAAACLPVRGNATKIAVSWKNADLGTLTGRDVRFRFSLTRGRLYAFWVSPRPSGESRGYPAAGGPGFSGPTDSA
jgi:hypothetical protein